MLFDKIEELVAAGNRQRVAAPGIPENLFSYHDLFAVSAAGLPWIEIDFPEDLEKARTEIYPQILRREHIDHEKNFILRFHPLELRHVQADPPQAQNGPRR